MPRVLITGFSCFPAPVRSGVQLRHCIRALAARYTVDVLVIRGPEQAHVERQGTARILRVPVAETDRPTGVEAFRRALSRQLEGADYDVVHFLDSESGLTALAARTRGGYATVFDVARSPMARPAAPRTGPTAKSAADEEKCIENADLVLVPTEPAFRYAAARVPASRICEVGVGVDVDRFDWEEPPVGGRSVVFYAGFIGPGLGLRLLVHAMEIVCRTADAELVLVGEADPAFAARLRTMISDLGLGERVRLVGAVDHLRIPELIATATVCVAPAAAELSTRATAIFPTKILEYMSCMRPVVASRRSTTSMIITYGTNGLLFEPGDPLDLARKLTRLIEDEPLRRRLSTAGYEYVRRHHTASAVRRSMRRAYAHLFEDPRWCSRLAEGETRERRAVGGGYASVALFDDEATVIEAIEQINLSDGALEAAHDQILEFPPAAVEEHTAVAAMQEETTENTPVSALVTGPKWIGLSAKEASERTSTAVPPPLRGARFVGGEIGPTTTELSPADLDDEPTPTPIDIARLHTTKQRK